MDRPRKSFKPLATRGKPGHPWRTKHVPFKANSEGLYVEGEWIEDTFDDAIPFVAWITWLYDPFPSVGQRANLVVFDYWGHSFTRVMAKRDYDPKLKRELEAGGTSEEEPDITIEAGLDHVRVGDQVAWDPKTERWYSPPGSAYA